MLLGHGVVYGDEMLVFHLFDGDGVGVIGFLRFQGGQSNAAAADHRVTGGVDHVAAEGADIEFAPEHIGGNVLVDNLLPVHQLDDGNAQRLGQGLQQSNIGQALGSLPFGDGFAADADLLCQVRLCQIPAFPQLLDGCAGNIAVHKCHFLSHTA